MNLSELETRLTEHGERVKNTIASPFDIESEELTVMKKQRNTTIGLLIAAIIIFVLGTTVLAAYHFLTPSEIAERVEYHKLADVLATMDTKFDIPFQQSGDYTIQLLGIVSGENLSYFSSDVSSDRSYIIVSVSRSDEKPFDCSNLMLTPLISGYKPWEVNIFTLGGGKSEFIEDNVDYFIYECDNIEMFADHTVYIALYCSIGNSSGNIGFAPSSEIFTMESDGSIHFNESYTGIKALFTIPLDKSKANPEKAAEYIQNIKNDVSDNDAVSSNDESEAEEVFIVTDDGVYDSDGNCIDDKIELTKEYNPDN